MADDKIDAEGNVVKSEESDSSSDDDQSDSSKECIDTEGNDMGAMTTDAEKRKLDKDEDSGGGGGDDGGTKKQKISMGFTRTFGAAKAVQEKKNPTPITIKLGGQKAKESAPTLRRTSASVAEAFNQDSDEEEMPPEAKMRMRNIGRDTPTSAGPNSFGKTRQGFCDAKKVFERQLKRQMDEVSDK